jgi:hypothetical protein
MMLIFPVPLDYVTEIFRLRQRGRCRYNHHIVSPAGQYRSLIVTYFFVLGKIFLGDAETAGRLYPVRQNMEK